MKVAGPSQTQAVRHATTPSTTPLAIADLDQAFGWAAGSWQDKLLQAADASAGHADGKLTRAELDAYLSKGADPTFATSSRLWALGQQAGAGKKVDAFSPGNKALARAADLNGDGTLTQAELLQFVKNRQAADGHGFVADQEAAAVLSAVASKTGEADGLNTKGLAGTSLERDSMHITQDESRRDPAMVSYVLTPQDMALSTNPSRTDNFHTDTGNAGSSKPSDYAASGYDQGHQRPAEDSTTLAQMQESFLMTNMAPQTPQLNRMSWRVIETGVRQLVQATGAKATINTGNLYCDQNGKPLPADKVKTIGPDKVAVPTFCFKTVLLEYPDGHKQTMAFMMPNRNDLPIKGDDEMRNLIRGSMLPVSKLEGYLAAQQGTAAGSVHLYPELGQAGAALKKQPPPAAVTIPNAKSYPFANFIWPQSSSTSSTRMRGVFGELGGPTLDLGTLEHPK